MVNKKLHDKRKENVPAPLLTPNMFSVQRIQ